MEFKDRSMWEQVVFSIDKHFTGMDLLLCPAYLKLLHHLAHRVESAVVAAGPRNPRKISQKFIEIQKGRI